MRKTMSLIGVCLLAGCAGPAKHAPAPRDPASESASSFKLVRAIHTSFWSQTDCNGTKKGKPCSNVYASHVFDDTGALRLIVSSMSITRGEKTLAPVITAFVVRNGESSSNFGNQFPAAAAQLIKAIGFLQPAGDANCPVTIQVSGSDQVTKVETPCHDSGAL
ncbi:MAG: hypothetical protein KF681_05520 [Bdellovibrionaceae bacterium]|nr:hypothetical protein [Pseudobdellovibrionaceae bacterium]